jgi:xanthine/uracil permease
VLRSGLPVPLHKIFESGISACAIVAVVLNLLFNPLADRSTPTGAH